MTSTLVSTRVDRVSEVNMTAVLRFDDRTHDQWAEIINDIP
jgi:hypothetical protein